MKNLKLTSILISLMAIGLVTVFLTSCKKEPIITEEQPIENIQNLSSDEIVSRNDCDKWYGDDKAEQLSSNDPIELKLTSKTKTYRAPKSCAYRGFQYEAGITVKIGGKLDGYYWVAAPYDGSTDNGWILIPNSGTTTTTATSTSITNNPDCKWVGDDKAEQLSSNDPKELKLTSKTNTYRAPKSCAFRDFQYQAGITVKIGSKLDGYYWVAAPHDGSTDYGWILIPNSGTTTTTTTTTSTSITNNPDCKWVGDDKAEQLSSNDPKELKLTSKTNAYRAPKSCAFRDFQYQAGITVKIGSKLDGYYWVAAPHNGSTDYGWILIENSGTTGSTTTTTTTTNNVLLDFVEKEENNPFICNGTLKEVGHFVGFLPGEEVQVSWPGRENDPSKGNADSQGRRLIRWNCSGINDIKFTAYGVTSKRTVTYDFITGSSGSTGGTNGGSTGGTNGGITGSGLNCYFDQIELPNFNAVVVGSEEGNYSILAYDTPHPNSDCREMTGQFEQSDRVKIESISGDFVFVEKNGSGGWIRSNYVNTLCYKNDYIGSYNDYYTDFLDNDFSSRFLGWVQKYAHLEGKVQGGGLTNWSESILDFKKLIQENAILDIKNSDNFLINNKHCGIKFFGRDVHTATPGNVLFGLIGYLYWKNHYGNNSSLFLQAASGLDQGRRKGLLEDDWILSLGISGDWSFLSSFDPPCDSYEIALGAYIAETYGSDVTAAEMRSAINSTYGSLTTPGDDCYDHRGNLVETHPSGLTNWWYGK